MGYETEQDPCEVCNYSEAVTIFSDFDGVHQKCPRCGEFKLDTPASSALSKLKSTDITKVSGWIRNRFRSGEAPILPEPELEKVLSEQPPSITERENYLLLEAEAGLTDITQNFDISEPRFLAASYSNSFDEIAVLYESLIEKDFIKPLSLAHEYEIRPKGFAHLEALKSSYNKLENRSSKNKYKAAIRKIFISYDSDSRPLIVTLAEDLKELGHTVWFDQELSGGQTWWDQILENVRTCDVFVFALAPRALESVACTREYEYAFALGKPIIPVLITEGVSTNLLPFALSQIQYVDFRNPDEKAAALRVGRALNAAILSESLPDPLPPPPDLPVSREGNLSQRIAASRPDFEEQSAMLVEIKASLNDPASAKDAIVLLDRLRNRHDLYASIEKEIVELIRERENQQLVALVESEMVTVPAGTFLMGSPGSELGRSDGEGPQHQVTIQTFAISRYAATFEQYDAYIEATGGVLPSDEGWGRDNRPVINVSWEDVQGYIAWLNERSGGNYRLPTEAEWEYASRAGTNTAYSWGDKVGSNNANGRECGSRWGGQKTAPVGSFAPNALGLCDMHGNVWEWVQDCYVASYEGAPTDGSAREEDENCLSRVLRGGSWGNTPQTLRSANRNRYVQTNRDFSIGFRLAQDLSWAANSCLD